MKKKRENRRIIHDIYLCITSRISNINFSSLSSIICPSKKDIVISIFSEPLQFFSAPGTRHQSHAVNFAQDRATKNLRAFKSTQFMVVKRVWCVDLNFLEPKVHVLSKHSKRMWKLVNWLGKKTGNQKAFWGF